MPYARSFGALHAPQPKPAAHAVADAGCDHGAAPEPACPHSSADQTDCCDGTGCHAGVALEIDGVRGGRTTRDRVVGTPAHHGDGFATAPPDHPPKT